MNYAPRYLGRGSWLARRDPRVLVIAIACFVFSIIQVWDGRIVAILFAIALVYYRSAGIPFREVRRNWAFVITFVSILVAVNTLITGGQVPGIPAEDLDVWFTIPILGTPVSAQSIAYAWTQLMRFLAMAAVGFPLAFAMAPADFGVTFRRLGVPDKFAYGLDLTFRFLPSFGHDMQMTIDAQRIRGFDWEAGKAGIVGRLRRTVPIVVPTVINAIAGAEDTIDAMDLRGFGTGPRTWLRHLVFDRLDRVIVLAFVLLLVACTIAGFTTASSELWTPPFLIDLAGG
jgi:energy-coupling factor transport system permease protein